MINQVLDDKIRIAMNELLKAQPLIRSAIAELYQQNYTTEADNLATVLDNLIIQTNAALDAIH
jgi:hypothetical protein